MRSLGYWLAQFGKTRRRLYWLMPALGAFATAYLVAAAVLGKAVEPCCRLLPEIVAFVIPGLPTNAVELWARFPLPVSLLFVTAVLIAIVDRLIQAEENEWAFQAGRRGGPSCAQPSCTQPSLPARLVAWCSPVFPLISFVLFVASAGYLVLTVAVVFLSAAPDAAATESDMCSASQVLPSCSRTAGPRRLAAGDAVMVVVRANLMRNGTGLLLAKGETYEARHVSSHGWKDGDRTAQPWGIQFEGLDQFFTRWLEWFRPYREGTWFQVLGRIETGRKVFPVLGGRKETCSCPQRFTAPRDGELILLVNDVWYSNNSGFMTIEIRRLARQEAQAP